jgi:hypothetical protein
VPHLRKVESLNIILKELKLQKNLLKLKNQEVQEQDPPKNLLRENHLAEK